MRKLLAIGLCLAQLAAGVPPAVWAQGAVRAGAGGAPVSGGAVLGSAAAPAPTLGSWFAPMGETPALESGSVAPTPEEIAAMPEPLREALAPAVEVAAEDLGKMPEGQARETAGRWADGNVSQEGIAEVEGAEAPAPAGLAPAASRVGASRSVPRPAASPTVMMGYYKILRALMTPLVKIFYSARLRGLSNIPRSGPALLVPNHPSFVDGLLLSYAAGRPVRFLLYRRIYDRPGARWFFRAMGAIPIAEGDARADTDAAIAAARQALRNGELVAIFPEGRLTGNGNMARFRRGFAAIAKGLDVPIVPIHIDGLWGSIFSRRHDVPLWEKLKRIPRPVIFRAGAPLQKATPQAAREAVQELGAESLGERVRARAKSLPRAFLESAKRRFGAQAVADSTGRSLSFGRALTATVLLAGLLSPRLGEAKNVGVLLPPAVGGVLANTALGSLGKVPVNLNYTASREAMDYAVAKAGIKAVLTSKVFLEKFEKKTGKKVELSAEMIFLEDLLPAVPKWKQALTYVLMRLLPRWAIEAIYFRAAPRDLDETAAILFTSGSTALPKGVELTHANLQSNLEMVREVYAFNPDDILLGVLPFFHSFGLTVALWLPLLSGFAAAYHTSPFESDAIAELAAKQKPTLILGTPAFLGQYAKRVPAEAFARLRLAIAGAEKLRPEVAEAFKKKFGVDILEGYGATELSPIAAVSVPDNERQKGIKAGSVGHPMPGVAVKVVDPETFEPLPYGTPGLLLVKGPNVMKGYLGEPEKTAKAVKDGWYHTGDRAFIDKDGFIFLSGRFSRFSKLAGEMVSHEAVEEKLQKAAGATEQTFVVTGVPDSKRGERLVVLHKWDGAVDELLSKVRELGLPALWTPGRDSFYKVPEIPLLPTGKLDLKTINELAQKLAADLP